WKALELTWGALQGCAVSHAQLKPLLQAALAEASRLGAPQLVVRQLDVDEVLGRCLALALEAFPAFSALKLYELNLYDEALGRLSSALLTTEHLRALVLDTVWASASGWGALGSALKMNTSLQVLRMRYCLGGAALPALCGALADQQGVLATLQLSHNELRDAGVGELCKALTRSCSHPGARPSRVTDLELSQNLASKQCAPGLAAMLRVCKGLRRLDLSYNDLGAEGTRELCRALAYAPHIASLSLAATGADDSTVEALSRSLSFSTAGAQLESGGLEVLSLAQNRITQQGAAQLAAAARRPGCGLADVDLAGNGQIGEQGAKAWAAVLSAPGARLRRLVLSGCEVPDGGAYALGAALKANSSLLELGLAENHISTTGLGLLAEVVKVNGALRVLDVSCNMVGPQGMLPFSQMAHLHGHVYFSKAHDHTVKRVGSCLVKAELLREYRAVEAVKNSQQPWEEERGQRRQAAADFYYSPGSADDNPFLPPPGAAEHHLYSDRNPFLSPAESYVNPFLSPQPSGGPYVNPFLSPAQSYVNPFLSPQPSEPAEAADGEGAADGPGGRTHATRVLSRR
ncbi:Protein NLRC3, partial [Tetrabaena socialis]